MQSRAKAFLVLFLLGWTPISADGGVTGELAPLEKTSIKPWEPDCQDWHEGKEVRTIQAAICRGVKAGLNTDNVRFFHVHEGGKTEIGGPGTHWMVRAIKVETCGPGRYDTFASGVLIGLEAAAGRVVTRVSWPFSEVDSSSIPLCGLEGHGVRISVDESDPSKHTTSPRHR